MPDFSGLVIPEQKFEGLYKLGEAIGDYNAAQQKQALLASELKKAQEKAEKDRKTAGFAYLDSLYDSKQYATGDPNSDKFLLNQMEESKAKLENLVNQGFDQFQLRNVASQEVKKFNNQKLNIQAVNKNADKLQESLKNKPGVDAFAASKAYRDYHLKDTNGQPLTDFSNIQVDDNKLPEILKGANIYNQGSFDNYIKTSGKEFRSDNVVVSKNGKTTKQALRTNAPNGFIFENDANGNLTAVPKFEIATSNDAPVIHKFIKDGKEKEGFVRMVTQDQYNTFDGDMLNYLDQEAEKYAKQLGTTPDPTNLYQFKKALAYYLLENSAKSNIKVERETGQKINLNLNMPSEAKQAKQEQAQNLYSSFDTEDVDGAGRIDITKYVPTVNAVGKISFGQGYSIKMNPKTKEVTITDSDNNETKMPFAKFISTVQTNNTKEDRDFIALFGKYSGKGGAKTSPTQQPSGTPYMIQVAQQPGTRKKLWEQ